MNAVSAPICIAPPSTRCPPNQNRPTIETFMMSMTIGNIVAIHRPVDVATSVSSSLASPKRSALVGLADERRGRPGCR